MSYCVNCGVELDSSLERCPLCNTIVINPNQLSSFEAVSPYPVERGQVDESHKKDLFIFVTTLWATIALSCGVLNFFVFTSRPWSLVVIGFCVQLWALMLPLISPVKLSYGVCIVTDGAACLIFLKLIALLTRSDAWLWGLGLPIAALCTLLVLLFHLFRRKVNDSILASCIYLLVDLSLLCIGIELLCRRFADKAFALTWSAIVLTVCIILSVVILMMFMRPRLRESARRRLHF